MLDSNLSSENNPLKNQDSPVSKLINKFNDIAAKNSPKAKRETKADSASLVVKTGKEDTPKTELPTSNRKLSQVKATPLPQGEKMQQAANGVFSARLPKISVAEKTSNRKEGHISRRVEAFQKEIDGLKIKKLRAEMNLLGAKIEDFYDDAFSLSGELYQLKKEIKDTGSHEFDEQYKVMEQKLSDLHVPKASYLAKAFGEEVLKQPLSKTLAHLTEQKFSDQDIRRDKTLFSCKTDYEVKCMYLQRMVKAERTGYTLSMVSAIENTWQEFSKQTQPHWETKEIEGYFVEFLPKDKIVLVKEGVASRGSYKVVFKVTEFMETHKASQRGKMVFAQPEEDVELQAPKEVKQPAAAKKIEEEKVLEEEKVEEADEDDSADFSTSKIHVKDEREVVEFDYQKKIKNQALEVEKVPAAAQKMSYNADDEMRKEAAFIKELKGRPGIWETSKVVSENGKFGLLQPLAGYEIKLRSGKPKTVVTLSKMAEYYKAGKLSSKDQIVYFNMLKGALQGVKSQHDAGIINRDVKLDNTLCSSSGGGYVTDFGTCCHDKVMDPSKRDPKATMDDPQKQLQAGSPGYASPEQLEWPLRAGDQWKELGPAVDVWGVGMMLWEGASGLEVHDHFSIEERDGTALENGKRQLLVNENIRNNYTAPFNYPEPTDKSSLAHLTWECLQIEPSSRPTMAEVLEKYDHWLADTQEKIKDRVREDQELEAKGLQPQRPFSPAELYGELPLTPYERKQEIKELSGDIAVINEVKAKYEKTSEKERRELLKQLEGLAGNERKLALRDWAAR